MSLLEGRISACQRCGRLANYCATFRELKDGTPSDYWARAVPGFGDPMAELLVIGLAPGAQGANRTGRPFTGDAAGEVLYRALNRHGFSNLAAVEGKNDGLQLRNTYITNAVKCVPPGNKALGEEKIYCLDWLADELEQLSHIKLVLAMGREAFQSYLRLQKSAGRIRSLNQYAFEHNRSYSFEGDPRVLLATYHFSRYNMNTGVLTPIMVESLFQEVVRIIEKG